MAFLSGFLRRERASALALAAMAAMLAGCFVLGSLAPKERRFAFSHREHVAEQGLGCVDCHRKVESEDEPGLPTPKPCLLCHADLDAEKPVERRVEALFQEKQYRAARAGALSEEVIFSHRRHATYAGLECGSCHAGIEANDDVLELARPDMDRCTDCHAARGARDDCATCHARIRADARPASHGELWMRRHGQVVRFGAERTVDRCELCHQESSCTACHLETPPDDHTNYWRRRGHGLTASLDRETCAACHRSDSCDECHSENPPLDHSGAWGAPIDRHCLSCHFPLQNEGCVTCHAGTPSHALATPMPPDHSPLMDCRMCHGVGQSLPHVDNGDDCNLCHH